MEQTFPDALGRGLLHCYDEFSMLAQLLLPALHRAESDAQAVVRW